MPTPTPLPISSTLVRRLAVTKQRLAGPRPAPGPAGLLEVARDLGCIQLDPISAVDRTHRLVWFSRAGRYTTADLDQVLWQERQMFEYWAHCASLVLTEDYPLHSRHMQTYRSAAKAPHSSAWIKANDKLRRYILRELKRGGPLPSRALEEDGLETQPWVTTGWNAGRNVSRMLFYLIMQGTIMVAGRVGGQKLYDLAERVLPAWAPRDRLSEREVVRRAAEKSLRALGVATPRQISQHFIRWRYPDLPAALADLEKRGCIQRVSVEPAPGEAAWKGPAYIHTDDRPPLDGLAGDAWQPRTVLLSPFDNLICDRVRTRLLFNFDFTIEIYVPKPKRKYGYYVLPILHGDQLIGRFDSLMDRSQGRLNVNAVYAEPGAPLNAAAGQAVAGAVRELAEFLGATSLAFERDRLPAGWKRALLAMV